MLDEIRELFAYNRWANRRTLDAVSALSEEARNREVGGSFGSLHKTLIHAIGAEWVWLRRWQGTSPLAMPDEWSSVDLQELRRLWSDVEAEQAAHLAALTADQVATVVRYRNFAGHEYEAPFVQLARHVVNHATYHRGQVTLLLRQLGSEPANTDLVRFYRESSDAP